MDGKYSIEQFVADRDAAFLSLDRVQIEAFARTYGIGVSRDEQTFWAGVHKARTAAKNLPTEARALSKRWLEERGLASWDDGDL